ncbi:MAG: hypothetical protein ABJH72_21810 [Reichenbachiella sp.]|uniref:hypothetical protein n=1 Tax=Reichenbachiella sp. TaxID=2184521 RepID=UPI003266F328
MTVLQYTLIGLVVFLFLLNQVYNYLSGKKFVRDYLHYFLTTKKSLKYWDNYCANNPNQSDIIVSFSTIPSRISEIVPTVKSLLSQRLAPKKIHLYVPQMSMREKVGYVIPEEIKDLKCLEVKRVDKDWGPSTKFIPAVESLNADQKILVVDDDNMYPRTMLTAFDKASDEKPEWIVAASGWRVPDDLVDRSTTLWTNITKQAPVPVPTTRVNDYYPIDIVQGYSGFLIRPKFFNFKELTDYPEEPRAVRFVDDVWVSAHALVPKYVFPSGRFCYIPFWTEGFFKANSLASINNHGKERDEDRNNSIALRYFEDKWHKD